MAYLTADLEAKYRRFLIRAVEGDQVWVLVSRGGKGATFKSLHRADPSGEPAIAELVFSDAALASRLAHGEWSDYAPLRLPLDRYLGILPQLDGRLIVPDATHDGAGVEVEPGVLAAALRA